MSKKRIAWGLTPSLYRCDFLDEEANPKYSYCWCEFKSVPMTDVYKDCRCECHETVNPRRKDV